jgi:hypothetical protein
MIDMPKMIPPRLMSVEDFLLATAIASAGMLSLWAAGHPVEEWPTVVVVLYASTRLAMMVVTGLLACLAGLLADYGERVLQRHGIEVSDDVPADSVPRSTRAWLVVAIVSTVFSLAVGVGIAVNTLAVGWLGITPLAPAFSLAASGLLLYGGAMLGLLLGAPATLFFVADARIVVSEARLASVLSMLPEIKAGIPSAGRK